jgi:hypothetical protein
MKRLILLGILIGAVSVPLFGFHYDFSVEEIPMMAVGTDISNNSFYSFYNIANLGVKMYADDQTYLKFRLKDTYFDLYKTNSIYVDRLSITYFGDDFGAQLGRDYYVEGDGILIGNLADGIKGGANLLGLSARAYVYYSGFLPIEVNQFQITPSDLVLSNGPSRLFAGIDIEKKGLGIESVGLIALYSQDLSTNNSYNPVYIGINAKSTIFDDLVIAGTIIGEFGNLSPSNAIQAFGGNLGAYYLTGGDFKYGFVLKFSAATGNNNTNTGGGQADGQFDTFGQYVTGVVVDPKLADMVMAQAGGLIKASGDHLTFTLNYYYYTRMTTNDSVNGFYTGSGYKIGQEISGGCIYDIDPDLTVFVTGGYFITGDAFADTTPKYLVLGGVSVRI